MVGLFVGIVGGAAVLTAANRSTSIGTAGPTLNAPPAAPVVAGGSMTATSAVTPASGDRLTSDDFSDGETGWRTGTSGSVHYAFDSIGYRATMTGQYDHFPFSPYEARVAQLRQTVTASLAPGAPAAGGFGAVCAKDVGTSTELHYEFHVTAGREWYLERRDGVPSSTTFGRVLQRGPSPGLGHGPLSVTLVCATLGDQTSTRVVAFIGSQKVADLVDATPVSPTGWIGGLMFAGGDGKATVAHATSYVEAGL